METIYEEEEEEVQAFSAGLNRFMISIEVTIV
jgi:hypothetical protein